MSEVLDHPTMEQFLERVFATYAEGHAVYGFVCMNKHGQKRHLTVVPAEVLYELADRAGIVVEMTHTEEGPLH